MIFPSYFFSPQKEFLDTYFTMILLEILSPHLLIFFWNVFPCKGQGASYAPTGVIFTVWNCPSKPLFLSPTPHNQYCCYSREWLLFLKILVCRPLRFSPFISLDKILNNSSPNANVNTLSYHLIVITWLIPNMKIRIRQIFLDEMFPWFLCRCDQVLKSKGMWCKQEIHKLISWACRLGFRWKWVYVNGEWLLVDKLLTLLEGTHPFHG